MKRLFSIAVIITMLASIVLSFSLQQEAKAYDPPYFPIPTPPVPSSNAFGQKGLLDVTLYGAYTDDSHAIATTDAIQRAVNDGYTYNMAVFFPPGIYKVNNTIEVVIPSASTERFGNVLVGATTGATRPVIHLMDGSAGFDGTVAGTDPTPTGPGNGIYNTEEGGYRIKPVLHFWRRDNTDKDGNGITDEDVPNENFNNMIRGIDFDLGVNEGAAAIYHQGCEGSVIEDVKITATNAFGGLFGLLGSGGSTTNIEVEGGKFGIYGEAAQPAPLITGLKLQNQTINAVFYSGRSPLTIVGFHIAGAVGPEVIKINKSTEAPPKFNLVTESSGNLSLVDGSIRLSALDANATIIKNTDRSVFLKNVYVINAGFFIKNSAISGQDRPIASADQPIWSKIDEYAVSKTYSPSQPDVISVDGTLQSGNYHPAAGYYTTGTPAPSDFIARHVWPSGEKFAAFDQPGVINVESFGAVGDGATDNTAAIQSAINSATNAKIFFPKGVYMITDQLVLKKDTQLFGISAASTWIQVKPTAPNPSTDKPIIKSYDDTTHTSTNALANIKLVLPVNLKFYAIDWMAGRNSIVKDVWVRPISVQDNNNVSFNWVKIHDNGGGRWYNLLAIGTEGPGNANFRIHTINNTTEPLLFYMYHSQYAKSLQHPQDEINNSRNISLFSAKFERRTNNDDNAFTSAIQINGSDNINIIGNSGVLEPLQVCSPAPCSPLPSKSILYLNSTHTNADRNLNITIANMGKNNGGNNNGWNYIEEWWSAADPVKYKIEGDTIATLFKRGSTYISTIVTP